jgi:hypothetical protein
MVVVPLHNAGSIQDGLLQGVSSMWEGGNEQLTLITTANTIGPRISSMFRAATMAVGGYSYGYTE